MTGSRKGATPVTASEADGQEVAVPEGASKVDGGTTSVPSSGTSGPGPRRPTKAALIQQMLADPEGTTLAALAQATGWQAHTVRAALTRLRPAGPAVERSRSEAGETVYSIVSAGTDAASLTGGEPTQSETAATAEPASSAEASPI